MLLLKSTPLHLHKIVEGWYSHFSLCVRVFLRVCELNPNQTKAQLQILMMRFSQNCCLYCTGNPRQQSGRPINVKFRTLQRCWHIVLEFHENLNNGDALKISFIFFSKLSISQILLYPYISFLVLMTTLQLISHVSCNN